jgi:hypothetical protein
VKMPRFRIAWVMVFVAIAALNFTAIRMASDRIIPSSELLGLGALPMANVLAVGLLIGQRRRSSRPFLLGFEVFGAVALALYVDLAGFSPHRVIDYLELLLDPIRRTIGLDRTVALIATIYPVGLVMLGLPQLAFALVGGFLSRRFKVTITPR